MSGYADHVTTKATPQTEPIPGSGQVKNSAGGFVYEIDSFSRLNRFLVLGTAGGTYYATEKKLTVENAACLLECFRENPRETVARIIAVSDSGLAPKNDPAVFALAFLCANGGLAEVSRQNAVNLVCRTGTHFLMFVSFVKKMRGFGEGMKRLIAAWYASRPVDEVAFQVTKYQNREGWTHRDTIRAIRPSGSPDESRDALIRWVVRGKDGLEQRTVARRNQANESRTYVGHSYDSLPRIVRAFEELRASPTKAMALRLIESDNIPREFVEQADSKLLNDPDVWSAMLPKMPLTAMIRNLGKMSAIGLLKPMSQAEALVVSKLADQEHIRKSRVHPMAVLVAAKTYAAGKGVKGSLTWAPTSRVNDALDGAFSLAFGNVRPAGKRTFLALDVSGSMGSPCNGVPVLSCCEAAAAMAVITARTEPLYYVAGFASAVGDPWSRHSLLCDLNITKTSSVLEATRAAQKSNFGSTDCSLPMLAALANKWEVDTFVVLTDNETYAGSIHPSQALKEYRHKTGINAKLVVQAFTATSFSIADPADPGMLDVCGLDVSTPQVLADFSAGRV